MTGLYNRKGSTVISSYEYTYYASGNRKSETDASGRVTSYTYDDLNRIVTESDVDNTITYTYDACGNRTKRIVTGLDAGTTAYIYDSNNRLTLETTTNYKGTSITAYEYDKNGNNTAKVCGGERLEYVYDALGKLKMYTDGESTARYSYNSGGIRTLKWVDGDTTKYILNGGDVVGEVNNGVTTTYLRGINLICTDEYYYVFDAHGDVVNLTDDEGSVVKTYVYDAFGVEKNPDEADSNPFRYCGEYWDSETETYYLRARSYDPNLGRFTSEDTHWNVSNMIYGDNPQKINEREDKLGLTTYSYAPSISAIMQSGNLYAYCGYSPLLYRDYSGNAWWHWALGAAIVAAAAVAVVVTAGGVLPAMYAVGAVASGTAAATTASTVAAGAFIGSSAVMCCALLEADYSSIDNFNASANWGTVAFTAGGLLVGGATGYKIYKNDKIKIAGKGSTGRVEAKSLNEQLAMKQVLSDPLNGATQPPGFIMRDPRWPASDGWVKMQNIVELSDGIKINIHFVYNTITKVFDDFKFK